MAILLLFLTACSHLPGWPYRAMAEGRGKKAAGWQPSSGSF